MHNSRKYRTENVFFSNDRNLLKTEFDQEWIRDRQKLDQFFYGRLYHDEKFEVTIYVNSISLEVT